MIPLGDVVPTRTTPLVTIALCVGQALAFMDLPAGPALLHVAANVAMLWSLGNTVEDRMGHVRHVAFYVLCAGVAAVGPAMLLSGRPPILAALSGGVAGVIGGYLVLYPASRLIVLVPVPGAPRIVEVPAVALAAIWMVLQFAARAGTTAVAALAAGALVVPLFRRRERMRVEWWNELTERR